MLTLLPKSSRSDSADGRAQRQTQRAPLAQIPHEIILLSIITRDERLTLECEPGLRRERSAAPDAACRARAECPTDRDTLDARAS
eukprot:6380170-Prymnesium_polylepis.1